MQPAYQQEWHTLGQESILSPLIQFYMHYQNKNIAKHTIFIQKV